MTMIFAHRGSSGKFPENTMIAFENAEKDQADGIELDVQLSKDGEVVIIHDYTVNRTTDGEGFVKDMTLEEMKKLNAGANFQKGKYKAEIPTLSEFFDWFKGTNLICNIELKTTDPLHHDLEEKTAQLVKQYGLDDRIIFSSFNHYAIVYCYRLAPHIETAALFMEGLYKPWIYAESIHAKGIHPYHKAAPAELVQQSEQYGIKVRPFTVNREQDLKAYFEVNTSAVFTDFPDLARKVKNG